MALLTAADIATYMDITFTNVQEDAVDLLIDGLQSELEAYLRRPIEQAEFTEEYRIPNNYMGVSTRPFFDNIHPNPAPSPLNQASVALYIPAYTVYLRQSPVVSVSSVTITAAAAGATPEAQVAETDYIVRRYGIDLANVSSNDLVEVVYTAGLDGANIKALRQVMLRAAVREVQNIHDDTVGLKDLTTRNVAPLDTGFTERELMSVKRYRRVRVA